MLLCATNNSFITSLMDCISRVIIGILEYLIRFIVYILKISCF